MFLTMKRHQFKLISHFIWALTVETLLWLGQMFPGHWIFNLKWICICSIFLAGNYKVRLECRCGAFSFHFRLFLKLVVSTQHKESTKWTEVCTEFPAIVVCMHPIAFICRDLLGSCKHVERGRTNSIVANSQLILTPKLTNVQRL